MAKINHNRPILKWIDACKRELQHQNALSREALKENMSYDGSSQINKNDILPKVNIRNSNMPSVHTDDHAVILNMLNAYQAYQEAISNNIRSLFPNVFGGRKKRAAITQNNVDQSKIAFENACYELVVKMVSDASSNEKSLIKWVEWLQSQINKDDNWLLLGDLFDLGIKPAFKRIEEAL